MEHINRLVKKCTKQLENSNRRFEDVFNLMFSFEDHVATEWNDGYKIYQKTYGELRKDICSFARFMRINHPEIRNEFIGVAFENSNEWIIAFWGILMSGNKPYLVNMRFPTVLTNANLEALQCKYYIALKNLEFNATFISFPNLENVGVVDIKERVFANEIALNTSATSLNQKVCVYDGNSIVSQILNTKSVLKRNKLFKKHYKGKLKLLAFLPLYHIFGFVAVYLWFCTFGRTLVFLKDYSSQTIIRTIQRHEVTHIFAVPLFWHTIEKELSKQLLQKSTSVRTKFIKGQLFAATIQNIAPLFGLKVSRKMFRDVNNNLFGKSVKVCISGGSYIKESTLRCINGLGYYLVNGYGMSEIGITSVEMRYKYKYRISGSIGKPFESVSYSIKDNILEATGNSICKAIVKNGILINVKESINTGDIAHVDKDGNYYLDGRETDLIIKDNGENINPDLVEKGINLSNVNNYVVMGLNNKITLIVELSHFMTEKSIQLILKQIQEFNANNSTLFRIELIRFTFDPLMNKNGIKVSRTFVSKGIENETIKLYKYEDIVNFKKNDKDSINALIYTEVTKIVAEVLGKNIDEIKPDDNIFFDLGGNSLEYLSIINAINEKFDISIDLDENSSFYTTKDLSSLVERYL